MKAYLYIFVNWKYNDWDRPLPIVKFAYDSAKNACNGYTFFKLNSNYHPCVFFKDENNPSLRSCLANKLAKELKKVMLIYQQNLLYAQELQKQANNKSIKSCSYTLNEKVWLKVNILKWSKIENSKPSFLAKCKFFI